MIAVCKSAWLQKIYCSSRSIPSEIQSSKVMRHLDKHTRPEKPATSMHIFNGILEKC